MLLQNLEFADHANCYPSDWLGALLGFHHHLRSSIRVCVVHGSRDERLAAGENRRTVQLKQRANLDL